MVILLLVGKLFVFVMCEKLFYHKGSFFGWIREGVEGKSLFYCDWSWEVYEMYWVFLSWG